MKDKIIEYRREIDSYMQLAEKVKQSGESTLAWRNLQLAKGWLGKALGFLGETTPYTPADKAPKYHLPQMLA